MTAPDHISEDVATTLGQELLEIHEHAYGRGAKTARVVSAGDAVIVFLDGLELQRNEEFLIEHGRGEAVVQTRALFQESIEATFRAAVERATGREVVSFVSMTKLDPSYCVEVFRLAPHGAD